MTPFLSGLSFAAPWALALLPLLPLLWRLLRVTPPWPRPQPFPAIRLLFGLRDGEPTASAAPPWLLALRLALAACLILAVARPVFDPAARPAAVAGVLLLVVDDGWASARDWPARRQALERELTRAGREGRAVQVLTTAPSEDGLAPAPERLMPATEVAERIGRLVPRPWPTDRRGALAALENLSGAAIGRVVWLHDGLDGDGAAELARALQSLSGRLEMIGGASGRLLLPPPAEGPAGSLSLEVRRRPGTGAETLAVRGLDDGGAVLARTEATLSAGTARDSVVLALPAELRNRLARMEIEGEDSAAATVLMDGRWHRHRIGLAAGGQPAGAPLLDRLYYLDRALAPVAELSRGEPESLLSAGGPEILILADLPLSPGPLAQKLAQRVESGAILIRFAGPLLAQVAGLPPGQTDPLLPVRLRRGDRALGGAMSWTAPAGLAPFAADSPFLGLEPPADVTVRTQVLAEPESDLAGHVWAALADGTPLVTARPRGRGWVVLVHTSANADWSNLPLSGLFPHMLRRLAQLSPGESAVAPGASALPPVAILDGFGRLGSPNGRILPLAPPAERARPGPRHPPGLYGEAGHRFALNLSPALPDPSPLAAPPGATRRNMDETGEGLLGLDLGPALLTLALVLLLTDGLASLWLRGLLGRRGAGTAAVLLALLVVPSRSEAADPSTALALDAGLATRLACVKSFDAASDRDCLAGLSGLTARLSARSTAVLADPMLVDPERDPVLFFPVLYWRVTATQRALSPAATERLNTYMARGGVLVIDTADEGQPGAGPDTAQLERLRQAAQGLAMPPLMPLAPDHVLNRSFYLLRDTPGRWDGGAPWVQRNDSGSDANDGVSPVILGGADWVGAWAVDRQGRPLHPVTPGGERQREMAYRFGINLVMYALTGNYKADQVHLPAIMERLGR